MLDNVVAFLRKHLWVFGLLSAVGGALLTAATTDFAAYRTAKREALKTSYEQTVQADSELYDLLRKFADKANGKAATSEEDIKKLQAQVAKVHTAAERVSVRFPKAKTEFEAYAKALVKLQQAAEELKGPLDGAPFVESVSDYYVARQAFDERVSDLQGSWWG